MGVSTEQVLVAVERLREEMHDTFNRFGRMSPLVLLKSQELDALLNHYNGLVREENIQ
jgi:hypothetical protein